MGNAYYDPQSLGLVVVAQNDISTGSYEYDEMVVWQHTESGAFYWAQDSGCSCPTPFDGCDSLAALERVTRAGWDDFEKACRAYDIEVRPEWRPSDAT